MIENGFIYIPETAAWLAEYLHEMTVFPKGKHDDQVDSTAQFLDWFGDRGFESCPLQRRVCKLSVPLQLMMGLQGSGSTLSRLEYEGVTRSMRRWSWDDVPRTRNSVAARWDIGNEYHVQDMLWAILAPIFPDLDDEEWLKSLGQHRPRADLAIPSLELIVEVKFLRPGGKSMFSDVIQEVATDASTYLQDGSDYRHIIAFVWDDAARTEEHAELRQGLLRIRGVFAAIVLPRPSKMKRLPPQ
jgi:hypothetical protein